MADKKVTTKGLVVRSVEASRSRSGYRFTSSPQFVDVQADGLTQEELDAITDDPYLMAVEVDKAPANVATSQRVDADGKAILPGTTQIGNATFETATAEMLEAAKAGESIPTHPSAPGGTPQRTVAHPDALVAQADELNERAEVIRRRPGRPAGSKKGDKKSGSATTASGSAPATAPKSSEANKE